MGLTEQGFLRRTYDDILNDKIKRAIELFGNDIDTSELTPLGKFIRITAYDQSIAEEEIEALYYSIFPDTATGVSLDRLCTFVGISREQATPARYKIEVTGETGTELEYGFLVGTESEITYYNTNAVTIDETGKAAIIVECETAGEIGNVAISEITQVVNPVANLSISCIEQTAIGTGVESDISLRKRFNAAREGAGSCNANAIKAALLRVPTVTDAIIVENSTDSVDESGMPAHSFQCYVAGGENHHAEIAETIFDKKPIGIKTYGNESQDVTDESGTLHTIAFSHIENVNISVYLQVKTDPAIFDKTRKDEIRDNVSSFISGLGSGESVIRTSLYAPIYSVAGVIEVTFLSMGKTASDGTSFETKNITIEKWQKANCSSNDIAVGVEE